MPRISRPVCAVLASILLASWANAQVTTGIHWQQDIEAAKSMARDSGRLVLVHVYTDECGPCRALETNVFMQPGVAGAIEERFVPVKLNANEYPAIAQGFGITRVPTDVILSPDGQVISKMISPATPAAYVAETTDIAGRYASESGRPFQQAAAAAPDPAVLNPAYAGLKIGASTTPMVGGSTAAGPSAPVSVFAPPAASASAPTAVPPATVMNNYAPPIATGNTLPQQPVAPVPTNPAANPYAAYAPPTQQPAMAPSAQPVVPPVQAPGYDPAAVAAAAAPRYNMPANPSTPPVVSAPPAPTGVPVAESAQQPISSQQAAAAPDTSKLPPGAPPLGFDGYCPVSMRTTWKWVPGNPQYGAIHRGRTYWFVGPQEQQEFLANPDYYGPALAGNDPVLAIDHHQAVPGVREHSLDYDGQFFLFSSEATLQQFTASPERYASGVRQAMGMPPSQQTR